ncbi:MAG: hypothetical protein F4020_04215 [Gammaproteobacteria bacterium]|nr:hypothetical protein [Gammaproteobacteria bacterium]
MLLWCRREGELTNQLSITLDGPDVTDGSVPVAALVATLDGVQDAMRLMVLHLAGLEPKPGRPPAWVREQSGLRLVSAEPGSFAAVVELDRPRDVQGVVGTSESPEARSDALPAAYGEVAFASLLEWDGSAESTLPQTVSERLAAIPTRLPAQCEVWLGSPGDRRRAKITAEPHISGSLVTALAPLPLRAPPGEEEALLYGWLREVNWGARTAQLHDARDGFVPLTFGRSLHVAMLRLATQYVEVRGSGQFGKDGEWTSVHVNQLNETRSSSEPFDLDSFLNEPDPKIFDQDKIVTIDLPDEEWEAFDRAIRAGREA